MSALTSKEAFSQTLVRTNGIDMHVAQMGDGPSILFLHGFPDYWGVWAALMRRLSRRFRTIAPDLRGYGKTSRPSVRSAYSPDILTRDGLGLIDALDLQNVTLVGHDWGACLAFWMAMQDTSRISRLIILNGSHPYILQDFIWDDPEQRAASQYIKSLQSNDADQLFTAPRAGEIAKQWLGSALAEEKISPARYDEYVGLWSDPKAWPAMLNYYRAAPFIVPPIGHPAPERRWTATRNYAVDRPVTFIWGDADPVFSTKLPYAHKTHVQSLQVHHIESAGHVPHRDEPDICAELIAQTAHLPIEDY